ncbi:hypothetical protein ACFVTY_38910 [Streptomyces sp. NPDC058067]
MSIRAVLVAAVVTGLLLGAAATRADHSAPSRRTGPIAEAGR